MHDANGTPTDILVKLYTLPAVDLSRTSAAGVDVRRARAWERHRVVAWVAEQFETGWASEVEVAYARQPIACFVAQRAGELLGFACYDSSALGFFGPLGVTEGARGGGVGAALLLRCLQAMREQGYGYAVIGAAGPVDFYLRLVDGLPIPGSWPGIYGGTLAADEPR